MTFMNVFTLLGGLAFFLFGMNTMGNALEKSAGNRLKTILGKLTSNKFKGFLLGLVVTAVIYVLHGMHDAPLNRFEPV